MREFWITGIALFMIFTFLIAKLSLKHYKKENGDKMWKQFGIRTRYWQVVVLGSLALTFLVLFLLKWTNILTL